MLSVASSRPDPLCARAGSIRQSASLVSAKAPGGRVLQKVSTILIHSYSLPRVNTRPKEAMPAGVNRPKLVYLHVAGNVDSVSPAIARQQLTHGTPTVRARSGQTRPSCKYPRHFRLAVASGIRKAGARCLSPARVAHHCSERILIDILVGKRSAVGGMSRLTFGGFEV